jgi:hypothetical protein
VPIPTYTGYVRPQPLVRLLTTSEDYKEVSGHAWARRLGTDTKTCKVLRHRVLTRKALHAIEAFIETQHHQNHYQNHYQQQHHMAHVTRSRHALSGLAVALEIAGIKGQFLVHPVVCRNLGMLGMHLPSLKCCAAPGGSSPGSSLRATPLCSQTSQATGNMKSMVSLVSRILTIAFTE